MSESKPKSSKAELQRARKWNIVWVVPILAVLIGGWMLWKNLSSKGPEIEIRFETADGIIAGKTELKARSVTVGRVSRVTLSDDLQSVEIVARMNEGTENLLAKGTRFWVVRPRVSAADVSGLGTLLTGAYIEMDPEEIMSGEKESETRSWVGLETPPATSGSVPGLRMTLVTDDGGALSVGAPIYYRGFEVGRIESCELDADARKIYHSAFIKEEYQALVRENTKFWNTSGIDIAAGVDGFKIRTPSFQSMVSGGVAFSLLEGAEPGEQARDNAQFDLHADYDSAASSNFVPTFELLLLVDQTVRGLAVLAPVEYRGIKIGKVKSISFDNAPDRLSQAIPVLVEIDLSALRPTGAVVPMDDELRILGEAIDNGLRGTLKTGSYLTGAVYVDFDYYPEEEKKELTYSGDYPVLPTLVSGIAQIELKLTRIMDTIASLPLNDAVTQISSAAEEAAITAKDAKKALAQIEGAAAAARETMEDPEFKSLPADVRSSLAALDKSVTSMGPEGNIQGDLLRTLDELRGAIRSMESMTDTIKEKPNSLLFGRDDSGNPRPKAAGRR